MWRRSRQKLQLRCNGWSEWRRRESNRRPRLAALPENRPRRNQVAPVCFPSKMLAHFPRSSRYGFVSLAESSRLPAALYGPLHVPVGLALRDVAALVPTLLAPGEREL